jgi:hypothetical protein
MERFAAGYLYFSHAVKFREFENTLKIKGQGDRLEGASRLFAQKLTMQSHENPQDVWTINMADILTTYGPANKVPVFCLFSCLEKDCVKISEKEYRISLDDEIKNDITTHFEKADTAVIIENPDAFIDDIRNTFASGYKADAVNYFHVEGFPLDNGGRSMDMEYFKYLAQDTPPTKIKGGTKYSFGADFAYRALFCKDIFFSKEQEYRVLLPKQQISEPKEYFVDYTSSKSHIVSLDDLFSGSIVVSIAD